MQVRSNLGGLRVEKGQNTNLFFVKEKYKLKATL